MIGSWQTLYLVDNLTFEARITIKTSQEKGQGVGISNSMIQSIQMDMDL